MKISFCLITLNEQDNLDRCLSSFRDLADEIVILDSGSTDRTAEIAQSLGARVVQIPFQGFGDLRNRACEMARGEIIVHWDDDDWYPADRISRQMARLWEAGIDLCATSRIYFIEAGGARAWEYC